MEYGMLIFGRGMSLNLTFFPGELMGIFRFLTSRKNIFSELFDCTIIPICVASGETSDVCVVHCLSIPAFIERGCALRRIENQKRKYKLESIMGNYSSK